MRQVVAVRCLLLPVLRRRSVVLLLRLGKLHGVTVGRVHWLTHVLRLSAHVHWSHVWLCVLNVRRAWLLLRAAL